VIGAANSANSFLGGPCERVCLGALVGGSAIKDPREELSGRSVLVRTGDQLATALALIELDGVASRIVLCPPDLPFEHLPLLIESAAVDVIVTDRTVPEPEVSGIRYLTCGPRLDPVHGRRSGQRETEWILLTSGTTGLPKLVIHTLTSLMGAIDGASSNAVVWSTFYDIRRYGGLQIFLRALVTGASLVLSSAEESTADFLVRAGLHGVSHISGTPSHWRRALMDRSAHRIAPQYIRLSGEIVDQTILNNLRSFYPEARIVHAFASTEAGVAFEVTDGLAGFPQSAMGNSGDVRMKVDEGSLRIRSNRTATRYLGYDSGRGAEALKDSEGFVDTADILELRGDRYFFAGRRDGVINIGGLKVHPEEVEAAINRHPRVQMSLVRGRKSPVTGSIVVADVVLRTEPEFGEPGISELQREIMLVCRETLPAYKVPAVIKFVPVLAVAETGKLIRHNA
jgi:acyl-coenzyme A synthetase/AMP-(fatty) acid ligase